LRFLSLTFNKLTSVDGVIFPLSLTWLYLDGNHELKCVPLTQERIAAFVTYTGLFCLLIGLFLGLF
jgi:hypothetical protein